MAHICSLLLNVGFYSRPASICIYTIQGLHMKFESVGAKCQFFPLWLPIYWFLSEILLKSIRWCPKSVDAKWHALIKYGCHSTHGTHAKEGISVERKTSCSLSKEFYVKWGNFDNVNSTLKTMSYSWKWNSLFPKRYECLHIKGLEMYIPSKYEDDLMSSTQTKAAFMRCSGLRGRFFFKPP